MKKEKNIDQLIQESKYLFLLNYIMLIFFVILDFFTNIYFIPLSMLFAVNSIIPAIALNSYKTLKALNKE